MATILAAMNPFAPQTGSEHEVAADQHVSQDGEREVHAGQTMSKLINADMVDFSAEYDNEWLDTSISNLASGNVSVAASPIITPRGASHSGGSLVAKLRRSFGQELVSGEEKKRNSTGDVVLTTTTTSPASLGPHGSDTSCGGTEEADSESAALEEQFRRLRLTKSFIVQKTLELETREAQLAKREAMLHTPPKGGVAVADPGSHKSADASFGSPTDPFAPRRTLARTPPMAPDAGPRRSLCASDGTIAPNVPENSDSAIAAVQTEASQTCADNEADEDCDIAFEQRRGYRQYVAKHRWTEMLFRLAVRLAVFKMLLWPWQSEVDRVLHDLGMELQADPVNAVRCAALYVLGAEERTCSDELPAATLKESVASSQLEQVEENLDAHYMAMGSGAPPPSPSSTYFGRAAVFSVACFILQKFTLG